MTIYLWYSREKEGENSFDHDRKPHVVVYLDSEDEPVRVSVVTSKPRHDTGFEDIQMVDRIQGEPKCVLVGDTLQSAGIDFCRRKGIQENARSITEYMEKLDHGAEYRRKRITVHRPIKLKMPGNA